MPNFRAPDGSSQPINSQTVQHLGTVPPFSLAFLDTRTEAAWEQAVVVYINGVRQSHLLGKYHHRTLFWLPQEAHSQQIMVAGWHKRSRPDGGQRWHASRGRVQGEWAEWDDSGGDLDFNDFRTRVVKLPGLKILPFSAPLHTSSSIEVPSWHAALFLASLANVRSVSAKMPEGEAREGITQFVQDTLAKVENELRWHSTTDDSEGLPSHTVQVALELNAIANVLVEGDLRAEIQQLIGRILQTETSGATLEAQPPL
jgi:hypothetical protein